MLTETGGSIAPFAVILSNVVGRYGAAGTALLAIFIIFGTVNAYTTGMSRVFYAVSRDGGFPRALDHLNEKTKVPDRALISLFGCTIPVPRDLLFFPCQFGNRTSNSLWSCNIDLRNRFRCWGEDAWSNARRNWNEPYQEKNASSTSFTWNIADCLTFCRMATAVSLAVSFAALIYTRIHFSGEKLQKNTRVKSKLR